MSDKQNTTQVGTPKEKDLVKEGYVPPKNPLPKKPQSKEQTPEDKEVQTSE